MRRNRKAQIHRTATVHYLLHVLRIGKHKPNVALIVLLDAVGRVVHLEANLRACRHIERNTFRLGQHGRAGGLTAPAASGSSPASTTTGGLAVLGPLRRVVDVGK